MEFLVENWQLMAPLIAIQLALQVAATWSLVHTPRVRGGNKLAWGAVIWVFQSIGPLVYFAVGRDARPA